jgi:hypothetical protein
MRGHIRERSPGQWAIVLDIRDPATGKRRRKWHSFSGTKRGATTAAPGGGFAAIKQLIGLADKAFGLRPGIWNPSHGRRALDGEIDGPVRLFSGS